MSGLNYDPSQGDDIGWQEMLVSTLYHVFILLSKYNKVFYSQALTEAAKTNLTEKKGGCVVVSIYIGKV